MAIFGKKEKEDNFEEKEELKKELRAEKKLSRKLKDLNPKDKKKRKEPPKPWGKRERLILLFILLATVFVSAFLAISARGGVSSPKMNFDSLNIFTEKTIIIEKR